MKLEPDLKMEKFLFSLVVVSYVLVVSLAWRTLNWVWLRPKKMEKYFKGQGIRCPPYRFFYGNTREIATSLKNQQSKPMELSHQIVPRLFPFFQEMVNQYGKYVVTWEGPIPTVTITDPELIRDVLTKKHGCISKIRTNPLVGLLARGVAKEEGEKWRKHRRIITPAFHQEKLKMMIPQFYTSCSYLISRWRNMVLDCPMEVDVWPYLQNLTAEVISRTAFGSSYEEGRRIFLLQTEQTKLLVQARQSLYIPCSRFLPTKRNRRMKEIYTEVRAMIREIIRKREEAMKLGEASNNDLLGILMESNSRDVTSSKNDKNSGLSIDETIEECKLFYFAGQETTGSLLVWTMIVLSMHPEWQEKAREEVLQVFGKGKPDLEGLNLLKLVTMILYEVLRLYTPIPAMTKTTTKEIDLGDVILPSGITLWMPTLFIHHNQDLWGDDVEEFNPDRFSEGILKSLKNQSIFFPFGGGPRICIGQSFALVEAKISLAMILQNFSFELSPAYVHAPRTIITIQPQHGAHLMLRKLPVL